MGLEAERVSTRRGEGLAVQCCVRGPATASERRKEGEQRERRGARYSPAFEAPHA